MFVHHDVDFRRVMKHPATRAPKRRGEPRALDVVNQLRAAALQPGELPEASRFLPRNQRRAFRNDLVFYLIR